MPKLGWQLMLPQQVSRPLRADEKLADDIRKARETPFVKANAGSIHGTGGSHQ
jgi:hypothetical protein